ncbi:gamma-glutamyl-gamma-aminobutyrate hydrolase family protein [Bifidobacterium catenulatum]
MMIEASGTPVMLSFTGDHTRIAHLADLPADHPSDIEHHSKTPYDEPVHTVIAPPPDLPLAHMFWPDGDTSRTFDRFHPAAYTLAVNSYHHQAVCRLTDGLEPMESAPDGIVEAVYLLAYIYPANVSSGPPNGTPSSPIRSVPINEPYSPPS